MSVHLRDANDDHLVTYAVFDCLAEARARVTSMRTATLGPYTGLTYGLGQYHLVFADGSSYFSCGASGPCPESPHA